ncbi:high-affinity glucose transporter Hxt2p [Diutina catenulata]
MSSKKSQVTHSEEVTYSSDDGDVTGFSEIPKKPEAPKLLSRQMMPLLCCVGVVYFASCSCGFDGSLMSSIYTQDDYMDFFKIDPYATGTSLVFSIYNIAQVCAAFFCPLSDIFGRKFMLLAGSLGTIVGAIITACAQNTGAIIGGRFLLSFFTVWANCGAALYVTEIAIAEHRSVVAGCYNTLWYVGSLVASFSAYGANIHFLGSEAAFRLPLALQAMFPGIVFVLVWFIPESPRWLVGTGREEKARQLLAKYHCGGDVTHPLIDFEIAEIHQSFAVEPLARDWRVLDLRPIFKNNNAYRTMLCCALGFFGQFSGNNVCSYYLPSMLHAVGMTSQNTNVLMNAIYSIVSWVASVAGSFSHGIAGRRKMFLGSTFGASLCLTGLAVATARYMASPTNAASHASLVFIYLFGVVFSFAFTPMQPIYPAEVTSNVLRGKSMILLNISQGIAAFINMFAAPIAMKNIRYWFYVFFVIWDLFEFAFVYFFFVETRGKTLEEMDAIFASKNPRKASTGNWSGEPSFTLRKRHTLEKPPV